METHDYETPSPEPYPNRASPEEERLYRWRVKVAQNTQRGEVLAVAAVGSCRTAAASMAPDKILTEAQADKKMRHHLTLAIMYGAAKGVRP